MAKRKKKVVRPVCKNCKLLTSRGGDIPDIEECWKENECPYGFD